MPINRPLTLLGTPIFLLALSFYLWLGDSSVTEENRLIENGQVTFVLLGAMLHGSRWRRAEDAVARDFHACLGLLCLSIAVREVDIDRLGPAAIFDPLENMIRGILIVAWLVCCAALFRHRISLWSRKLNLAFSPCSRISIIGILAYGFSWFFDKQVFPLGSSVQRLIEESIQLAATFFLAAAALWQPFQAVPPANITGEADEGAVGGSGATV